MKGPWGATRSIVVAALVAVPMALVPGTAQAAPIVNATLVQAIATSAFVPAGAPDPAGIAYLPTARRFYVADSEVEETTGAGWHDANLWRITDRGAVEVTGDTTSYTKEPTGLGFDPATGRMFIASDSGEKAFIVLPGGDGRYGTSDDSRTTFLAAGFGSVDLEDVAFDTRNGHMYLADGTETEVIDVDPVNGTFGDGDDTSTHFDVAQFGGRDTEGIGYDSVRDTLLVADRRTKSLYEVTPSGVLVQTITLTGISGLLYPSDVEIAPSSTGNGQRTYWVTDRAIDNGSDPNENDGMLFEVAIPSGNDAAPTVGLTSPAAGATVSGSVSLSANASDDEGVSRVDFLVDGAFVGSGTNSSGSWSFTWNSASVGDGSHTVSARATDTIGQTATDTRSFATDNDTSPTVRLDAPAEGAAVQGEVTFSATAEDDHGVNRVEFFVDDVFVGVDADVSGGWTYVWNSTGVADGSHVIRARAVDGVGQTANDTNAVSVDNVDERPSVTLVAPADGVTVRGTVTLSATATADRGVTQVEFLVDGAPLSLGAEGADGWSASWDTTIAAPGSHIVTARATDTRGQTRDDDNSVTVDNTVPGVQITSPDGSVPLVGSVPITATADADATSVAFYRDGSIPIGTDTSSAGGWSVTWNTVGLANGIHTISAVATDAAGNQGTSAPVLVTLDNPLVVQVRVASSSDDAEQKLNTNVVLTSTDLDMMNDGGTTLAAVGLRFTGVAVPTGATIVRAYVRFTTDEVSSTETSLTIRGQATGDAATFAATKNNILSRARTTANVVWPVDPWTSINAAGDVQRTPNLASVVREIVEVDGWTQGNAMAFVITGAGRRVARAFDQSASRAPVLYIEYEL